mgnify:CR=1 FL=1
MKTALLAASKKAGGQFDFARAFNRIDKDGNGWVLGCLSTLR